MQFLGNLGIDVNTLVAQIVNFGLLMLVLSYFVYKPTIKVIEENEQALREGSEQKQAIEKEKRLFTEQQKKTEAEARERNRRSVKELAVMTVMIKSRTYDAAKEESAALVEQTKNVLESQRPAIVNEIAQEMKTKFTEDFRESFDRLVPDPYQIEFQDVLFKMFMDRIDAVALDRIKDEEVQVLRTLRKTDTDEYESGCGKQSAASRSNMPLRYLSEISPRWSESFPRRSDWIYGSMHDRIHAS